MADLCGISKEHLRLFWNSFDTILCDVDGVLWLLLEEKLISTKGLEFLRKSQKNIHIVSNNTTKSFEEYFRKLKQFNIIQDESDLITPIKTLIHHLKKIGFHKEIFLIACETVKNELSNAGFKINKFEETPIETFEDLQRISTTNPDIGAVIIDWDLHLSYIKLQKAYIHLKQLDLIYITINTDSIFQINGTVEIIGPQFYQKALEELTNKTAINCAKPSGMLKDYINEKYSIEDPSRVLMIGDSINKDMAFATDCGFQKLMVLSGETTLDELKRWKTTDKYYYIENLDMLAQLEV